MTNNEKAVSKRQRSKRNMEIEHVDGRPQKGKVQQHGIASSKDFVIDETTDTEESEDTDDDEDLCPPVSNRKSRMELDDRVHVDFAPDSIETNDQSEEDVHGDAHSNFRVDSEEPKEAKCEDDYDRSKEVNECHSQAKGNTTTLRKSLCREVQESSSKEAKEVVLPIAQNKPFQVLWSEEDVNTLLEAMNNHIAVKGSKPNPQQLHNLIKGKLTFDATVEQVQNKIRTINRSNKKLSKRKFESISGEGKKVGSSKGEACKGNKLKDHEVGSIVMTLFRGNEADELANLDKSIDSVSQLLDSGRLSYKWKNMINTQVEEYLKGLDSRKDKLELFLKTLETATREHADNDTE